jgi:tetratricopeptide (TPR) repeat protein
MGLPMGSGKKFVAILFRPRNAARFLKPGRLETAASAAMLVATVLLVVFAARFHGSLAAAQRTEHLAASFVPGEIESILELNRTPGNIEPVGYIPFDLEKQLQSVLDQESDNALAHELMGKLLFHQMTSTPGLTERDRDELADSALSLFKKAIQLNPKSASSHLAAADIYLKTARLRQMKRHVKKALRIDPNNGLAHLMLAAYYMYSGTDREKAKDLALELLARFPVATDRDSYRIQAHCYEMIGRYYQFIGNFRVSEFYLMKGVLVAQNFQDQMNVTWTCAAEILGRMYSNLGDRPHAAQNLIDAAEMMPERAITQYLAALNCFYSGDYQNAEKYITRAVSLDGQDKFRVLMGYVQIIRMEYEKAEKLFQSIDSAAARIGFAHVLLAQNQYEQAAQILDAAVAEEGDEFSESMQTLGQGWILSHRGSNDQGLEVFERLLEDQPSHLLGHLGRAKVLIGLGRFEDAEDSYDFLEAAYPNNPFIQNARAQIALKKGDLVKAEQRFLAAADIGGKRYTCPYQGLGLLYVKQGRLDEAEKALTTAIEQEPTGDYRMYNELAKIRIKEGSYQAAQVLTEKSIDLQPSQLEAQELQRMMAVLQGRNSPESFYSSLPVPN